MIDTASRYGRRVNEDDGPAAAQGDPELVDAPAETAAADSASAVATLDAPAEVAESSDDPIAGDAPPPEDPNAPATDAPVPGGPVVAADAVDSAETVEPAGLFPAPAPVPEAGLLFPPTDAAVPADPASSAATGTVLVDAASADAPAATSGAARTEVRPLPSASLVRGPDRTPTAALAWVDVARIGSTTTAAEPASSPALLADAPRRSLVRPAVLLPIAGLLAVAVAYGATTALWPLNAVKPTTTAVAFQPVAAPAAAAAWPTTGSAAVSVQGIGTVASADQQVPMASITKLVTVLIALDKMPLKPGEQGPSFAFTQADSDDYLNYLRQDQSALDVPVDGSLTQYQLFEGILLGSANNYADRLARELWGSNENYAAAANQWLAQHDLGDIRVVTPSGFDFGNVATPRALIQLGEIAEKNPVIASIVKQKSVELPGAGIVENTNGLIDDAGIVGIKTGTIGDGDDTRYNLLSAKDVADGTTTVRIFVAALGQSSDQGRVDVSRALYADVEAALKNQPQTVTKGATLGTVDTAWGETSQVIAADDARVTLWNGASASATTKFALGDTWKAGAKAGTLALKGPLDATTVPLTLRTELKGPSLWWRLSHPLELFGLTK
ncbi:D-alanyl-D-alanine endopeptidase [Microbacterium azadirachtae]|uniref:D-alanyl-D-alanine endopeptidase n=1 Tax=Microbacterium azadirachtae TaxID=582680 RepID=A0A0F0KMC4_9MICO|nr:D-alanyl-D-alanine endopeptidase [Microbacterium azadirachtae]